MVTQLLKITKRMKLSKIFERIMANASFLVRPVAEI